MPYPIPALSKRDIRPDVAAILGDNWPLQTTGAGNGGGTTAVFASLVGVPIAAVQNKYVLLESGTDDSEYRIASSFAPATGTVTLRRAHTAQVASGVTANLHEFSPHLYTLAINDAIRDGYRALYRPILHHTFVRQTGTQRTIPMPRDMERVMRIMEDRRASGRLRDFVDRANSASDPGSLWTVSSGTWGITSEGLYAPGDTNGDLLLAADTSLGVKNGVLQAVVRGDTTASNFRVLALVFRYEDTANYLLVRLVNGQADLRRVFGGVEASLTTATLTTTENTDYVVRVQFDGSWVSVWVDDRQVILYELTGENLAYLGYQETTEATYGNVGVRLDKTGSPDLAATATRLRDYFCHEVVGMVERVDWERKYDNRMIEMQTRNRGRALNEGRMLWIEGMCELTQLAADTTFEALASESTATVEILKSDPAYNVLVQIAAASVLGYASRPAHTNDLAKRQEYQALAATQQQKAVAARASKGMKWTARRWG